MGEPPLFLAASVFYAIKDALVAARAESGISGPFRLDSPASAERIRNACSDRFTKLVRKFGQKICLCWFEFLLVLQQLSKFGGALKFLFTGTKGPESERLIKIIKNTVSPSANLYADYFLLQCPPAEPGTFTPWSVPV